MGDKEEPSGACLLLPCTSRDKCLPFQLMEVLAPGETSLATTEAFLIQAAALLMGWGNGYQEYELRS